MTVSIRKKGLRLWLSVPVSLVLFGLGKAVEKKSDYGGLQINIDEQTKRVLKRSLKQAKKNFGSLVLVDVKAADGSNIKIKL